MVNMLCKEKFMDIHQYINNEIIFFSLSLSLVFRHQFYSISCHYLTIYQSLDDNQWTQINFTCIICNMQKAYFDAVHWMFIINEDAYVKCTRVSEANRMNKKEKKVLRSLLFYITRNKFLCNCLLACRCRYYVAIMLLLLLVFRTQVWVYYYYWSFIFN